jgi:hypothetical protein
MIQEFRAFDSFIAIFDFSRAFGQKAIAFCESMVQIDAHQTTLMGKTCG